MPRERAGSSAQATGAKTDVQNRPLPGGDVMDLATPEQEILFDGVQFVRVRF